MQLGTAIIPPSKRYGPLSDDAQQYGQPPDRGYDSVAPRLRQDLIERAYGYANATMTDGKYTYPLFVNEVSVDITQSGSMAQSRFTRDFYPHNFVQPTIKISGQSLGQWDYGNLCNFVLHQQREFVGFSGARGLVQINLPSSGAKVPTNGTRGVLYTLPGGKRSDYYPNAGTRGPSVGGIVQGYVMSMPQSYKTGQHFPEYKFGLVVAAMIKGPFEDKGVHDSAMKTWVEVLTGGPIQEQTNAASIKDANTHYKWALQNSANITNTNQG